MINSPREVLEIPNVGHMTTSKHIFESDDKILMMTLCAKIMTLLPLFEKVFKEPLA